MLARDAMQYDDGVTFFRTGTAQVVPVFPCRIPPLGALPQFTRRSRQLRVAAASAVGQRGI